MNSLSTLNVLEPRYRRLLTLLPSAYRERRAEEMLGMLLDGAAEGQRWPRAAEAASLAGLAVRLRTGAAGGSPRASAFGEVLQRFAPAGLIIQTLYYASIFGELLMASGGGLFPGQSGLGLFSIALIGSETALPAAALVCLAAAQFLEDHGRESGGWLGAVAHVIVSPIVPAVAVMFGVSRAGRPVILSSRLLLLGVPAVAIPLASLLIGHMSPANMELGPGLLGGNLIEVAWEAIVTQLILAVACWSAIRRGPRPMRSAPGLARSV
jgi:hypothetical protein